MADYISVTALNALAKQVLAQCEPLSALIVCGEVSNFTRHYKSGHLYFTLKDDNAAVKCVMFRDKARLLSFEPQNGMLVLAYGHATLYERDGTFQLYAEYLRPFGAGAAQMAFDALKKKLQSEGLFDPAHKRPLPPMPQCIGVVTSKTGAALQDVRNVMERRWPLVRLLLAPVSVQGFAAEQSIVAGIRALDADGRPDVILVTRGGGSKEDLWVFNSERIARAAYACKKPVVSAVGHEIDYTILDYVADLRAPTPSAAAEMCVPDQARVQQEIFILHENIQKNMQSRCQVWYNELKRLSAPELTRRQHDRQLHCEERVRSLADTLQQAARQKFTHTGGQMQAAIALAASLNPYAVLARGYAMVTDADGALCTVEDLYAGQPVRIEGSAMTALCTVNTMEQNSRSNIDENAKEL